jgi:hypothetical protein
MGEKLIEITWLIDQPGMTHGVMDQKRGDRQTILERNALSYIAQGFAQHANVKELGRPYREDPALAAEVMRRWPPQLPEGSGFYIPQRH